MYAQIIDDTVGNTLVAASTLEKDVKAELEKTNNVDAAAYFGNCNCKESSGKRYQRQLSLIEAALFIRVKSRH